MDLDKETQEKIQELQSLEQNLQNVLIQKQAFQFELNETENALNEIEKSGDEVFKIVGQIMIKSSKQEIQKELKQKKDILSLRLKSIEKQESSLNEELEKIKEEVMKKIK
jgi:prefoldin beta subunit